MKKQNYEIATKITDTPVAKPRKMNQDFEGFRSRQEKVDYGYDPQTRANKSMQGNYQAEREQRRLEPEEPTVHNFTLDGHESRHTTQTMLASNNLMTGVSSLNNYKVGQDSNPTVLDLVVTNLPRECDVAMLKRASGSKHIINATVDTDNISNTCRGNGRV